MKAAFVNSFQEKTLEYFISWIRYYEIQNEFDFTL